MKITKAQMKTNFEIQAILKKPGELSEDDLEFVYENYDPGVEDMILAKGVYFTPTVIADELAMYTRGEDMTIVDLCAGIGGLSHASSLLNKKSGVKYVCVEVNRRFYEIGKRLHPDFTWVNGSIFDHDVLAALPTPDMVISNPPFGNTLKDKREIGWMKIQNPSHYMAIEIAMRLLRENDHGWFILPTSDAPAYPSSAVPERLQHVMTMLNCTANCSSTDISGEYYAKMWNGTNIKTQICDFMPERYIGL